MGKVKIGWDICIFILNHLLRRELQNYVCFVPSYLLTYLALNVAFEPGENLHGHQQHLSGCLIQLVVP